ncbi:MAG: lipoate--protein ligase family protein [Burkholderiales bacterium]
MGETWRLLDTGLASAARNIALNRALLEARRANEIGSTLRFLRCTRAALLGYCQSAAQELDLAYCASRDIPVQRRITAGPAMYIDERQLGWELYLHRPDIGNADVQRVVRRVCHAAATALSALGIDARYRRGGEIEVDGRALCTTGCAVDGDAVLLQATLWLDIGGAELARVLRGPPDSRSGRPLPRSVVGLKALLRRAPGIFRVKGNLVEAFESEFGVEFRDAELSLSEQRRFERALRAIDTPEWAELVARPASEKPIVEAVHACAGGALRVAVAYEPSASMIRQVWFSGDFTLKPVRTAADLEAALRDLPVDRLAATIEWFFASRPAEMGLLRPADFLTAVRLALRQPLIA